MKKYTFVLNFGYVESSSLSYLPFTSVKGYPNAKEALLDLALFFKEQYLDSHRSTPKKCCLASKKKDPESEYCSKCGRHLEEEEFDEENFSDWLKSMDGHGIDGFPIELCSGLRWDSTGLEGAPNQRFVYQAEWVITAALGYPHREDTTFEDICANRTKEKQESFTYY